MGSRPLSAALAVAVERYAVAAGFDGASYAGHSLRAGLATGAALHSGGFVIQTERGPQGIEL